MYKKIIHRNNLVFYFLDVMVTSRLSMFFCLVSFLRVHHHYNRNLSLSFCCMIDLARYSYNALLESNQTIVNNKTSQNNSSRRIYIWSLTSLVLLLLFIVTWPINQTNQIQNTIRIDVELFLGILLAWIICFSPEYHLE